MGLLWGYPFFVHAEHRTRRARPARCSACSSGCSSSAARPSAATSPGTPGAARRSCSAIVGAMVLTWTVVLLWPGDAPTWLLVLLVVSTGLGGPGSMIGFDLARTFAPASRLGQASGIVNVGGFTASLLCVLGIGLVLDAVTPGSSTDYSGSAYRWAMCVQYLFWVVGGLQVWRYRYRARAHLADTQPETFQDMSGLTEYTPPRACPSARYRAARSAVTVAESRCISAASSKRSTSASRAQNSSGSSAASGRSATIRSTIPALPQVERAHALGAGHVGCVVEVAVHDRARTLRRQRRQPAVLGGDHPVGRQQRERAAAVALTEQQAQGRRVEGDQVGEAAGDLAGQPALLGLHRQRGAGGVDHGHQRQVQLGGEPHPAPGLAQRARAERVRLGLPAPVLAEEDARRPAEPWRARSAAPGRTRPGRCR